MYLTASFCAHYLYVSIILISVLSKSASLYFNGISGLILKYYPSAFFSISLSKYACAPLPKLFKMGTKLNNPAF